MICSISRGLLALIAVCLVGESLAQDRSKIIRRATTDVGTIEVLDAVFGQDERVCDARDHVVRACDGRNSCEVQADSRICGDPYRGVAKELFIAYTCGDGRRTLTVSEDKPARVYCGGSVGGVTSPAPRPRTTRDLSIVEVAYGANDRYCDATNAFRDACENKATCSVVINNDLCGRDPAQGRQKDAYVRYRCRGDELETVVREGDTANLSCN